MQPVLMVSVLGAIALSGCAGTWKKPGATTADFDRDLDECRAAARDAVPIPAAELTARNDTTDPRPTEPRVSERGEERTRDGRHAYVNICLEGRGWHWQE